MPETRASQPLTPEQRVLRAKIANGTRQAKEDPRAMTEAARRANPGQVSYWERRVDPDNQLPPEERIRRAEAARKVHFTQLSFKASRARQARAAR